MAKTERAKPATKSAKSRIPRFRSIEEAAEFWDTHDSTEFEDEFEDVTDVQFVVRRVPANKAITVRVDERTHAALTQQAHRQGIGPSTLIRMWILERLQRMGHEPSSRTSG